MLATRTPSSLLLGFAVLALPLHAQDQLGRSVAVFGEQIVLLKSGTGRGPAAAYLYQRAGESWELATRLFTEGTASGGQSLGPAVAVGGGRIFLASGDPTGTWGAHVFGRSGDGWEEGNGLYQVDPRERDAVEGGAALLDMGQLMQILQPAMRVVAADGDRAVLAVVTGPAAHRGVRVYERVGERWEARARLEAPEGARNLFGASVAIRGDMIAVGAPGLRPGGGVVIYGPGESGTWVQQATLAPESLDVGSRFGSALALDARTLVVGAPRANAGTGLVVSYQREGDGWTEAARVVPEGAPALAQFGAAVAIYERDLIVGAPGANERRGAVFHYLRDGETGWQIEGSMRGDELDANAQLGAAVAIGERGAVVGAPGADGSRGRAVVFTRLTDGWDVDWIRLGGDLETIAGGEVRCEDGRAGAFSCNDVDLQAFLPLSTLGAAAHEGVSDVWGWADPETGREYALLGRTAGLMFVDITEPANPMVLGIMRANPSGARDIKVYRDHAFLTGDGAGDHGLLVFDLSRLRGVTATPAEFEPDVKYDQIASAHNLIIDTESGFAYPVGASGGGETCGAGLHMVDIRDPKHPTFAGCFTDDIGMIAPGRTHDGQCIVYRGPDADHYERQICLASNETGLRIVDVTDKTNPIPIAVARHPGTGYVHQGWLTEDQRYFYLDDELDEIIGTTDRTRTMIWDLGDLDDPVLVGEFRGTTTATDHNLYIVGDRMYQANYQAGLRVIDISDPENPREVAYFDTTPYEGNPPSMVGAWTAYPFFQSGTVIVSSMNEGLFILKPRRRPLVP